MRNTRLCDLGSNRWENPFGFHATAQRKFRCTGIPFRIISAGTSGEEAEQRSFVVFFFFAWQCSLATVFAKDREKMLGVNGLLVRIVS